MFTRRGKLVIGLLIGVLYVAVRFGAPGGPNGSAAGFNAVVVPGLIALVAGLIYVYRIDRPSFERRLPENGFPGTTRSVEVAFESTRSFPATVEDVVGRGLSSTTNRAEVTIGGDTTFSYEVTYQGRGKQEIGPLHARMTDLFGFVDRTFEFDRIDTITVYPPVQPVSPRLRTVLDQLATSEAGQQREEFARLREYNRGDSLRDVHWKTSAKRPEDDLAVKEFTSEEAFGEFTIAAQTHDSRDDELATLTASIVVYLLDAGFAVGLTTPDTRIDPATGAQHRAALLETLATLEPGTLPEASVERAALSIHTPADGSNPGLSFDDQEIRVEGVGDDTLLDVATDPATQPQSTAGHQEVTAP